MKIIKDNPNPNNDILKSGCIFNLQKFSIHDGEGIRTLVFFKGCPLRCEWCSNPESQNLYPEVFYISENCTLCKKCESICPQQNLKERKDKPIFKNRCFRSCNKCIDICPMETMKFIGEKSDIGTILPKLLDDKDFYLVSNGGVTISGGEPFYQSDFLFNLIKSLKNYDINIAVETCGFFEYEKNRKTIMLIDTFLYDLKIINKDKHLLYTWKSNENIIKNLFKLVSDNRKVIVRIPLIPSINDNDSDINDFIDLLKKINKNLSEVNILPYHKLGIRKYNYLGRDKIPYFKIIQDMKLEEILFKFKKNGINPKIIN